ncbi:MAG: protease inhibitor I42 family protein [Dehalococcoidales bacterium]|jgi:inhibitor of cysteine peptidase|nr:protease inhibitor I42 family protein [Dehalococcoidales bacterium]MDX9986889.1 protease inhibitor I42 family protein [Dehalococcoidales bacterium]NLE90261.1 protease inhibitor I42 family protein [Dehalococcoidales bacterium]
MKKLLFTAVVLVLSASMAWGCTSQSVKAYYDPEEDIDSGVSKEFIVLIALESNPSTGYRWEAVYNTEMLELVEETFEPGEFAKENIVGAGGTELFRFKALNKGQTDITFKYKRSWETEVLETKIFTVEIK